LIIGFAGAGVVVVYLLRPVICPDPLVHHPKELARD
jgi:hypothetical protein